MAPRLAAKLRVQAAIRRCSALGLSAMVVGRGDPDAGQILIKINRFEAGCEVLVEARDGAGENVYGRAAAAAHWSVRPRPTPISTASAGSTRIYGFWRSRIGPVATPSPMTLRAVTR